MDPREFTEQFVSVAETFCEVTQLNCDALIEEMLSCREDSYSIFVTFMHYARKNGKTCQSGKDTIFVDMGLDGVLISRDDSKVALAESGIFGLELLDYVYTFHNPYAPHEKEFFSVLRVPKYYQRMYPTPIFENILRFFDKTGLRVALNSHSDYKRAFSIIEKANENMDEYPVHLQSTISQMNQIVEAYRKFTSKHGFTIKSVLADLNSFNVLYTDSDCENPLIYDTLQLRVKK